MNSSQLLSSLVSYKRSMLTALIFSSALAITGCQTTKSATVVNNPILNTVDNRPAKLQSFNIRGKIGIITPQTLTQQAQSGSAFYAWAQQEDRFAIDLTGAMGIGHTVIEYNGSTATLVSEKTGTLNADSPDALLTKATGWSAPISQFSYWISGRPAPSDDNNMLDDSGRIATAHNSDWTANFSYNENDNPSTPADYLPMKIKVTRNDGYKVTLTIQHLQP